MREIISAPGPYIFETDRSQVPTGVPSVTGLAVVGPTAKGQAFVPTEVTSFPEYTAIYGSNEENPEVDLSVFNYLQSGQKVVVTRVLGNGGFKFSTTRRIVAVTHGFFGLNYVSHVLFPSKNDNADVANLNSTTASGTISQFSLTLSGSGGINQTFVTASLNPQSPFYISNLLGKDAKFKENSAFVYIDCPSFSQQRIAQNPTASITMSFNVADLVYTSSFAGGYDNAKTPWIIDENQNPLFRFQHLSHGEKTNRDVKISIRNIRESSDSTVPTTFDVLVRRFTDTDRNISILEQFTNVNLDPTSENYIASVIGDNFKYYDENFEAVVDGGEFVNSSRYVFVEVSDAVKNGSMPLNVKVAGMAALFQPISGFNSNNVVLPGVIYSYQNSGSVNYSGFDFSNSDNLNYLNPIPQGAINTNSGIFFKLNDNKFTIPFQGGLDGVDFAIKKKPAALSTANNLYGFDLSSSNTGGTEAYRKALTILSNQEAYQFDVITVPGVTDNQHSAVSTFVDSVTADRKDAVYIRDLVDANANIPQAIVTAAGIDSNYSAAYYPWQYANNINGGKKILVPPSVLVPEAIAYNDAVGAEFTAVAGKSRGALNSASSRFPLSRKLAGVLYDGKINAILKLGNTGQIIWGQKTLQNNKSALDRLNVRRNMISLRRFVQTVSDDITFEGNTNVTRNTFLSRVTPEFDRVKQAGGLYAYTIQMDDQNNTGDVIDRNQLVGYIQVWPSKTAEFIIIEFDIQPTSSLVNLVE